MKKRCFGALIDLSFDSFVLVRFSDAAVVPSGTRHKNFAIAKTEKSFFSFCFFSLSSSRKLYFFSTREPETHGQARWLACCVMWTEAFGEERLGFICATEMWQEREVRLENTNQLTLINKTFFFWQIFLDLFKSKAIFATFFKDIPRFKPS